MLNPVCEPRRKHSPDHTLSRHSSAKTWAPASSVRTPGREAPRLGKLGGTRQWIESVFDTLKGQLTLEQHGGRTLKASKQAPMPDSSPSPQQSGTTGDRRAPQTIPDRLRPLNPIGINHLGRGMARPALKWGWVFVWADSCRRPEPPTAPAEGEFPADVRKPPCCPPLRQGEALRGRRPCVRPAGPSQGPASRRGWPRRFPGALRPGPIRPRSAPGGD
ncbi:transposase [Arthrobacter sp. Hiyo1]|nr:transposase [Arthrobacter sp. Hiyo1]